MSARRGRSLVHAFLMVLVSCAALVPGLQAKILFSGGDGENPSFPAFAQSVASPGASLQNFLTGGPTLYEPLAVRIGPDGSFYVLEGEDSLDSGALPIVYRYSSTGAYIGVFIDRGIYTGGGATVDLSAANNFDPADMVFGPDGNLYIAVHEMDSTLAPNPAYGDRGMVLRFNGSTGAFMGIFVANGAGDGGENRIGEPRSLVFDPAGNLYVSNTSEAAFGDSGGVIKFSSTGAYSSVVIPSGHALLDEISGLTFHNGVLYASNEDNDNILSVSFNADGTTNTIAVFVTAGSGGLEEPKALAFGQDGLLYVVSSGNQAVLRFDGATGAFRDAFVPGHASNTAPNYDPYGVLIFTAEDVAVPLLSPMHIAALMAAILVMAGLTFRQVRRRRA